MFYIIVILAAIFAMPVKAFDGTPSPDKVTPRIFKAAPLDLPPDLMAQAPNQAAAAFTPEKVSFPSTDADLKGGTPTTITGYLYKPGGSGPFAAVVTMHGYAGLVDEKREIYPLYGQWGEILSLAGYIVLLVDGFQPRGQGSLCEILPISARSLLPWRESETHLVE